MTEGYLKFLIIEAVKLVVDTMGYNNVHVCFLIKLIEHGDTKAEETLIEDNKYHVEFKTYFIYLIKQETNLAEKEIYHIMEESRFNDFESAVNVLYYLLSKLGIHLK